MQHGFPKNSVHASLVTRTSALQPFNHISVKTDINRLFYGFVVCHVPQMRRFHLGKLLGGTPDKKVSATPYSLILSLLIFFVVVISMGSSRITTLMIFW